MLSQLSIYWGHVKRSNQQERLDPLSLACENELTKAIDQH